MGVHGVPCRVQPGDILASVEGERFLIHSHALLFVCGKLATEASITIRYCHMAFSIDHLQPGDVGNLIDGSEGSQMKLQFKRGQDAPFDLNIYRAFTEMADIQVSVFSPACSLLFCYCARSTREVYQITALCRSKQVKPFGCFVEFLIRSFDHSKKKGGHRAVPAGTLKRRPKGSRCSTESSDHRKPLCPAHGTRMNFLRERSANCNLPLFSPSSSIL